MALCLNRFFIVKALVKLHVGSLTALPVSEGGVRDAAVQGVEGLRGQEPGDGQQGARGLGAVLAEYEVVVADHQPVHAAQRHVHLARRVSDV